MIAVTPALFWVSARNVLRNALDHPVALEFGVDGKIPAVSEPLGVHAEYPRAHGMEGARPHSRVGSELTRDALFHLGGGFVGESYRKYPVRRDALLDERADARGEHTRLAAARSRYDQHRAFGVAHRGELALIQTEIVLHSGMISHFPGEHNFPRLFRRQLSKEKTRFRETKFNAKTFAPLVALAAHA